MFVSELPLILSLIFGGCCSNVFALEVLVTDAPYSGNLLTLGQFAFVALEGLLHQIEWQGAAPRLKSPAVPISRWFILVTLFFITSVLNNVALGYHISVPLHIIFRSGGLIVNMIMGALILKKRYSFGQIAGVIFVTLGVIVATLDNANTGASDKGEINDSDPAKFVTGITLLVVAMILSACMGLCQEQTYKQYGKQWREGLFYTHALALPFFGFFYKDLISQTLLYNASAIAPLTSVFDTVPVLGAFFRAIPTPFRSALSTVQMPKLWAFLLMNVLTQYVCIAGVNRMTAVTTSLTLNLVLNLRKFVSLIISVVYFGNAFGQGAQFGTLMVILGTAIYTWSGQGKPTTTSSSAATPPPVKKPE